MNSPSFAEERPLLRFSLDSGDVYRFLKQSDNGFCGFGEIYFSFIKPGQIKAWKRHTKMTMNLTCPLGVVKFVFTDGVAFQEVSIGEQNYSRLTVPPGIWFGFQGITGDVNMISNLSNIEHNEDEIERIDINSFNYSW